MPLYILNEEEISKSICKICKSPFCQNLNIHDAYDKMYDALCQAGKNCLENPDLKNLQILALAVYGWMPTVLDNMNMNKKNMISISKTIKDAKENPSKILDPVFLGVLVKFTNNSLVGASKFLHFLFPNACAIWDSNICRALYFASPDNQQLPEAFKDKSPQVNNRTINIGDKDHWKDNKILQEFKRQYPNSAIFCKNNFYNETKKVDLFRNFEKTILQYAKNNNDNVREVEKCLFKFGQWLKWPKEKKQE